MAYDKLVDSTQLDADLTSVADAIRTKGGTSADLAFPAGFVSAVEAIPSGGGGTDYLDLLLRKTLTTYTTQVKIIQTAYTFTTQSALTSFSAPNCTQIAASAVNFLENCPLLASINFPKVYSIAGAAFSKSALTVVVLPCIEELYGNVFLWCASLTTADLGPKQATRYNNLIAAAYTFQHCTNLSTLILRQANKIAGLTNINAFGYTPFASGGSGGTIYIPKALYDHLGDGSSLDYKAATNWSTIDGYGTITWAQIEGSQYENYYADGTPIT